MHRLPAIALALALVSFVAHAEPSSVCFDPAKPCPGFKANDLSFPLDREPRARPEQRSAPFFAVILKTATRCTATRAEADAIQALFPGRKVFYTRFECDGDLENNVSYSNVDAGVGFIAVYAGESRAAASEVLATVSSMKRFPGANLRSMQVIHNSP